MDGRGLGILSAVPALPEAAGVDSVEDAGEQLVVGGSHGMEGKMGGDTLAVGLGGGAAEGWIVQCGEDFGGEVVGVVGAGEVRGLGGAKGLSGAVVVGGDDWEAGGHGFENSIGEAFFNGAENSEIEGGEEAGNVGDGAEPSDEGVEAEVGGELLQRGAGRGDLAGEAEDGGISREGFDDLLPSEEEGAVVF